jgi:GT2 family glycosyltransferase
MITYNRPEYTALALERLLATCDESARLWVWQNGTDAATIAVLKSFETHPRMHHVEYSTENKMLRGPTNWFWSRATGDYFCKVDDDILLPHGWLERLRGAHEDEPTFGIISCWPFLLEDYVPSLGDRKIRKFGNGQALLRNPWVGGGGYMMKRGCYDQLGPLGPDESFPQYCLRAALRGWVNGYPYPLVVMDHFDDPRSPHCRIKTEDDFQRYQSLSARRFGMSSLAEMRDLACRAALDVQEAAIDPRAHVGMRARVRRFVRRVTGADKRLKSRFNP